MERYFAHMRRQFIPSLYPILGAFLIVSSAHGQCIVGNGNAPQSDDPNQRIGQSFRATCPGVIEYVELFCNETGTNVGGTLEIFSGSTVLGSPIHSQSYPPTSVVAGEALRIYLTVPLSVAELEQRTFELDMSLAIPFSGGNPYPGGRLFYGGTNSSTFAQSDLKFNVSILSDCDESASSITESACVEYIAPSGSVWMESGMIMDTIPNMAGCDSVITIDLTVLPVDTSVSVIGTELIATAVDAEYQWIDCANRNAPIPNADQQSFIPEENGSYAVIVTQGNCSDTSSCHLVLSTNMEGSLATRGSIFPNPSPGIIHLPAIGIYLRVDVFDALGRPVASFNTPGRSVDLSYLAEGSYFIRTLDEQGRSDLHRVTIHR